MTGTVRDGLPTTDEILQAAALLQIPIDTESLGAEPRWAPQAHVTALLAVLGSWITAYQVVQDVSVDRQNPEEMQQLVICAESEVSLGEPIQNMNTALWRLGWAGFQVAALAPQPHPQNPTAAITALIRAATALLSAWRDSHGEPGVEIDGQVFLIHTSKLTAMARQETQAALAAMHRLQSADDPTQTQDGP